MNIGETSNICWSPWNLGEDETNLTSIFFRWVGSPTSHFLRYIMIHPGAWSLWIGNFHGFGMFLFQTKTRKTMAVQKHQRQACSFKGHTVTRCFKRIPFGNSLVKCAWGRERTVGVCVSVQEKKRFHIETLHMDLGNVCFCLQTFP